MRKRSHAKRRQARPVRKATDLQVEEFERRDLGKDLEASGMGVLIRPRSRPTSILLDEQLVEQLRRKGAKRGLGYQTMLKVIVREHLHEY